MKTTRYVMPGCIIGSDEANSIEMFQTSMKDLCGVDAAYIGCIKTQPTTSTVSGHSHEGGRIDSIIDITSDTDPMAEFTPLSLMLMRGDIVPFDLIVEALERDGMIGIYGDDLKQFIV